MSQSREMFALEWVKGEISGALEQARQSLEAFAEMGRDETRMRTCLTSLHQVHGTLVMLELPGVALLADHLEQLSQGLLNKQFADDRVPCEVLMQGILELPVRLDKIQEGGPDTQTAVLHLVNLIRKQLSLDAIPEPQPVQFVAGEAALDRFEKIDGRAKIRRIRAAYQGVLLALLKGEDEPHFLDTLKKVGLGLERICQDTPSEILWQSFGEFVDSLRTAVRPLSGDIIKVLRRLDAEIRRFAQDGVEAILAPVPERLLRQLVDAAHVRGQTSSRLHELRRRIEPANDGELIASGREALMAASGVLSEELSGVKDQLDLLVRGDVAGMADQGALAKSLKRIATTCGVLGFESSRLIVLDQLAVLERCSDLAQLDREQLFGMAASLVQVEENLASVSLLSGQSDRAPGVSDAERQVLVESRAGLEQIKQAIVNFVGNGFVTEHLQGVAGKLQGISGALVVTGLARPAALLDDCRAFLALEIAGLTADGQPAQWERLDRFADCLSGIDYHLERLIGNVGAKSDDILDVVERSLLATGYLGRGRLPIEPPAFEVSPTVAEETVAPAESREPDHVSAATEEDLLPPSSPVDVLAVDSPVAGEIASDSVIPDPTVTAAAVVDSPEAITAGDDAVPDDVLQPATQTAVLTALPTDGPEAETSAHTGQSESTVMDVDAIGAAGFDEVGAAGFDEVFASPVATRVADAVEATEALIAGPVPSVDHGDLLSTAGDIPSGGLLQIPEETADVVSDTFPMPTIELESLSAMAGAQVTDDGAIPDSRQDAEGGSDTWQTPEAEMAAADALAEQAEALSEAAGHAEFDAKFDSLQGDVTLGAPFEVASGDFVIAGNFATPPGSADVDVAEISLADLDYVDESPELAAMAPMPTEDTVSSPLPIETSPASADDTAAAAGDESAVAEATESDHGVDTTMSAPVDPVAFAPEDAGQHEDPLEERVLADEDRPQEIMAALAGEADLPAPAFDAAARVSPISQAQETAASSPIDVDASDRIEFDLSDLRFDVLEQAAAVQLESPVEDQRADAELREVFSEEAHEVLVTLDALFPRWQQDTRDREVLKEIRRGFHTLKGSGRMVGAQQIGELAWAVENMLNRVLDGTLDSLGEIFLLAQSARALMPSLLEDYNANLLTSADKAANLIDQADVLASGGSLTSEDADIVDAGDYSSEQEERAIFLHEAREHVALMRSKTGRRKVQLDDELLMSLHTFVGSANLMVPGVLARCAEMLYEVGRAAHAQALRGPNVEVDTAKLFQQAAEYLAASLARIEVDEPPDEETAEVLAEQVNTLLHAADDTPSEEMLLGLVQLEAVFGAHEAFTAWRKGENAAAFVDQFVAAMRAIQGATFRPQVTDVARALVAAVSRMDATAPLPEQAMSVFVAGCERLLEVIDAISSDRYLPRVDDVVTALSDLDESGEQSMAAAGEFVPSSVQTGEGSALSPDAATETTAGHDLLSEIAEDAQPLAVASPAGTAAEMSTAEATPQDADQLRQDADQLDPELADIFFEEAEELLEALDASVQAFVHDGQNGLPLENILRGLHTLKGSARLTGLAVVGDRVHQFESFLSALRFGRDEITVAIQQETQERFDAVTTLIQRVRERYHGRLEAPEIVADSAEPRQEPEVEAAEPVAAPVPVVTLAQTQPENLSVRSGSQTTPEPVAQDMIRVRATLLENLVNLAGESSILRARVEQGISEFTSALDEMGTTIERLREQLRRLEIETDTQMQFRVESVDRRLEHFDPLEMDRYSQLQQLSRALSESASDMLDLKDTLLFRSREAETILLQQARVNTELQEGLMRTRMVPFSRLLPRLRRIVRQVATELHKDVDFHAFNAEGELDRNLLERMVPPLEHMLRNAVDHGIESTMVRRSFGKSVPGRIDLRLSREGGDIVIEIADDGMGIDVESVRVKAMERGLLRPDAQLTDEEVLDFVLAPGFSTAKSVTQISGRGVGLDVVNSEVKQLGGTVSIFSAAGKGTRFVLRVPFTVSVNRALMVTVGDDLYAIPLNTIEGIVLVDSAQLEGIYASEDKLFEYAGLPYRVRYLGSYLGRELPISGRGGVPLVLVRASEQSVAVAVDGVQGSREIVVKSLGPQFAGVGGISGATILGDGSVVVILDLLALIRSHGRESLATIVRDMSNHVHTRCVMVVDDSVTVRKVTSRLLERQGMDVIVAKDGVEAMSLLGERTPDIMLLDIEMPRMDGFEVARQMRHNPRIAQIPIIMISSRTGSKHKEHALNLGINRFLGKPFQENELLAAIDELDQRR